MNADAKPAHPPPWRWVDGALRDATGDAIIWGEVRHTDAGPVVDIETASPMVREQARLAPEMEALLRGIIGDDSDDHLDNTIGSTARKNARALLALVDAARKSHP